MGTAKVVEVEKKKHNVETKLEQDQAEAKKLDSVATAKAKRAEELQGEAITEAKNAKTVTQTAKREAEDAAGLTNRAKMAGVRAKYEEDELGSEKKKLAALQADVQTEKSNCTGVEGLRRRHCIIIAR